MCRDAFEFSGQWKEVPESGVGYTIVRATPTGDRGFQQLLIGGAGFLSRVRGLSDIPFEEDDIAESFRREPWD
jgi:hypothetical protein